MRSPTPRHPRGFEISCDHSVCACTKMQFSHVVPSIHSYTNIIFIHINESSPQISLQDSHIWNLNMKKQLFILSSMYCALNDLTVFTVHSFWIKKSLDCSYLKFHSTVSEAKFTQRFIHLKKSFNLFYFTPEYQF